MTLELSVNQDNSYEKQLIETCLLLVENEKITSQSQLKNILFAQGFTNVNQSLLSKLFARLGVIKMANATGEKIYKQVNNACSFSINKLMKHHIHEINHNEYCVIVKTEEGFGQSVEQLISHNCHRFVLGAVGGFNSVMVMPIKSVSALECERQLKMIFG